MTITLASGAGVVVAVAMLACGPRATPAPSFGGTPIDSVSGGTVLGYGSSLEFDSVPPQADTATTAATGGGNAFLRIDAETGSAEVAHADLIAGRITARIISTARVDTLGVQPGVNYIWTDSTAKGWREIIFHADSSRVQDTAAQFYPDTGPPADGPRARFLTVRDPVVVAQWHQVKKGCAGGGMVKSAVLDSLVKQLHQY